jgi:hypothetical protein
MRVWLSNIDTGLLGAVFMTIAALIASLLFGA